MNFITACLLSALLCGNGDDDKKTTPAFEVVLKSTALARGLDLTLGELATFAPTGKEAAELAKIVLGRAPVLGYSRTVNRTEVLQALAMAGQPASRFTFKGANEVVVQPVATEVPTEDIITQAAAVLRAVLDQEGGDVEFEVASRVTHVQAPPGRQGLELKARVRNNKTSANAAVVDVEIRVDGDLFKSMPVQFRLARYRQVLKTQGTIRVGTVLGPENLSLSREKLGEVTGLYLDSMQDVVGMIAKRNLQSGQFLTITDVGEPALIHKGELVLVVVTRGRVKVTVKAMANRDAGRGEMVTVTNLESHAQITGIAAAPGTVVVPTTR
jgi:flagellar basal body P-ring formation protein FlgA